MHSSDSPETPERRHFKILDHAAFALLGGAGALVITTVIISAAGALAMMRNNFMEGDPGDPEARKGGAYEACTLPGVKLADLKPQERSFYLQRMLLCLDIEQERISRATYEEELMLLNENFGYAMEEMAHDYDDYDDFDECLEDEDCFDDECLDDDCDEDDECTEDDCGDEDVDPKVILGEGTIEIFAESVRDFSSEYGTDSWSASKVLGAPDVFPSHGDDTKAWASLTEDGAAEHIEVSFSKTPGHFKAINIYETYNVGAVSKVELIGADGERAVVYTAKAVAPGAGPHSVKRPVKFGCSEFPVASVRVTLDSAAVPGWNEIDAISAEPCDAPEGLGAILGRVIK